MKQNYTHVKVILPTGQRTLTILYADFEAVGYMSLTALMNPSDRNLFLISPYHLELMLSFSLQKKPESWASYAGS